MRSLTARITLALVLALSFIAANAAWEGSYSPLPTATSRPNSESLVAAPSTAEPSLLAQSSISLIPEFVVLPVGGLHFLLATLFDGRGDPIVGSIVRFEVHRDGAIVESGVATTRDDGTAPFEYQGPEAPADDAIIACSGSDRDVPIDCATESGLVAQATALWRLGFRCRASAIRLAQPTLGDFEPLVASPDGNCGDRKNLSYQALGALEVLNEEPQLQEIVGGAFVPGTQPALVTLKLLVAETSVVMFEGGPNFATAEAGVARIELRDVSGSVVFGATDLVARVEIDCIGGDPVFGSGSSVAGVTLPGLGIFLGNSDPDVVTVTGIGQIYLNEETYSDDGKSLTRTALRFDDETGLIGDFVVGEATVGLDQCVEVFGSPGPRGFDIIKL